MAEKVNLDALIPREDLEATTYVQRGRKKDTVSISDLLSDSFFLLNIYKPDFQRETTEWDYEKIGSFVDSFIGYELIPAIILWQSSGGNVFVIDGAHRLSSLIAWLNDDYGDGIISRKFYDGNIPEEQLLIANKTRKYIQKNIGSYQQYKNALTNPDIYDQSVVMKARLLSNAAIQLQWVEGDVSSAERSFFNINQKAAPINPTEIDLIKSRKKANCISARAIMRMGMGHKYWVNFEERVQTQIEELSKEVFELMFMPKLSTPIKTLDVPMCGKHNSNSLTLIYEFVNICNSERNFSDIDVTGDETIACLKNVRKIARLINSNHPSSLGLHPLAYFYARNGAFRVSAFYAFAAFVIDIEKNKKKNLFIKHRKNFEKIYYANSSLVQVIVRKSRSALAGMRNVSTFFYEILTLLESGIQADAVINEIRKKSEFAYLPEINHEWTLFEEIPADFSNNQKSEIFITEALSKAPCCKICGGLLHRNAISVDHIERKQDGGKATIENAQLTHPYCNTGVKN
ncbi:DUF262 domain-containing protein [Bacteroides acidifaciens]|uniref:GmrSD restriction endonuclease domain-containing protein n=1 Tax=Bacteroides acidifaciens TaxID=85831 RepID=UPI00243123BF|nr:DUF262 domain-containing protein [Bacteroides acidifaciens]